MSLQQGGRQLTGCGNNSIRQIFFTLILRVQKYGGHTLRTVSSGDIAKVSPLVCTDWLVEEEQARNCFVIQQARLYVAQDNTAAFGDHLRIWPLLEPTFCGFPIATSPFLLVCGRPCVLLMINIKVVITLLIEKGKLDTSGLVRTFKRWGFNAVIVHTIALLFQWLPWRGTGLSL